jgi:hypothetical protein
VSDAWLVMTIFQWDSLEDADGGRVAFDAPGSLGFALIFATHDAAVAWAGSEDGVLHVRIGEGEGHE